MDQPFKNNYIIMIHKTPDTMLKLMDLYAKPLDYQFTKQEIDFIRINETKPYRMTYFIYNKPSKHNCYIGCYINHTPSQIRRSACENNWTVICSRELCDMEKMELYENYGSCNRRFEVWYYENIDYLIHEDLKYNIQTPQKFIDHCKKNNIGQNKSNIQKLENYWNKKKGILPELQQLSLDFNT